MKGSDYPHQAVFENLASAGQTVVMVTHEPDIAAHARRIVVLRDGLISTDERRDNFVNRLGIAGHNALAAAAATAAKL